MTIRLQHEWTPEHVKAAVALWQRLLDVYSVSAYEHVELSSGSYYPKYVPGKDVTEEWVTALVLSDGERVEFPKDHGGYAGYFSAVEVTLMSYSDGGGSDYDAANVRALADTPGVTTSTDGRHGEGSATMMLGEMPAEEDIAESIARIRHIVETMEALQDYPLINDETHDEYIEELADQAWGQYLSSDVRSEVETALGVLLGDEEAAWDAVEAAETAAEDPFREPFYSYQHPSNESWRAESATSVVHPFHDEAVRHVLAVVFHRTDVENDCSGCKYGETGSHVAFVTHKD